MITLNARWRIIESDDKPPYRQWLLQRNKLVKGKLQWLTQSFCQTRAGLRTAISEKIVRANRFYQGGKAMPVTAAALQMVSSLPDKIAQFAGRTEEGEASEVNLAPSIVPDTSTSSVPVS